MHNYVIVQRCLLININLFHSALCRLLDYVEELCQLFFVVQGVKSYVEPQQLLQKVSCEGDIIIIALLALADESNA